MEITNTVNFYFSIFREKGLFNLFKGLEEDLLKQYNELRNNNLNSEINLYGINPQRFDFNVKTGLYDESYNISWSIPKADKLIFDKKMKYSKINTKHLYSDVSNLNENKLQHYKNRNTESFEPIIVSYYLPIKQMIVIDGNHRLYESVKKGEKEIKAFVLSSYANSFIMNERDYKLYSFHHNLITLSDLCCNPFSWRFVTNDSLNWDTYCGDFKFKKNIFQKTTIIDKTTLFTSCKVKNYHFT